MAVYKKKISYNIRKTTPIHSQPVPTEEQVRRLN